MKLTKQQEKEAMKVYETYWDNYLKGDIQSIADLLDDDYTQVGSAETEVFTNKKDAVKFLYDTIDQVAGKLEMRNRNTKLEQQGELVLVHELCDIYVLTDDKWVFYSKARASTLMQNKKGVWKIIHQHSSFPDARTGEGENIAIDKIAEENRELREAVKRRTVELEEKNRELEIETALEKVRSSALAMKAPNDMLDVCRIISDQLQSLGVNDIRNVQTAIFYETKKTYINFEFYTKHSKPIITEVDYRTHELQELFASKMIRGVEELFSETLKSKEVKDWYAYQKTTNQFADSFLETAESLSYYWYSLGPVALGMSTYVPLNEQEIDLFKRFRNVFELAYRRYLDIQQAEAQAREAKIETALERVRSRTMGMQKSEELKEVIQVVYEQFVHLNILVEHAGFIMDYKARDDMHIWLADKHEVPYQVTIPYFDSPHWNSFNEAKEKGKNFFANHLAFEEKNKFYKELFKLFPVPDEAKEYYLSCPGLAISTVLLENVGLYIENFSGLSYTDEENNTLMRFGKVFQQTYTRFLDLQNAEANAREAHIEASLERVRSKAMSMHSPNDLSETVNVFFKELKTLGIIPIRCGVGQIDESTRTTSLTTTTSSQQGESFQVIGKVKQTGHPVLDGIFDHWKLQKEYHPVLEGEDIKAYYNVMNAQIGYPEYPEGVTQYGNNFFFKEGFIFAWTENLLSEEELIIFRRFMSVLSLTYRRYLDLKEAEERNKIIQAENDRKTKELEEARQLQLSLLPRTLPQLSQFDIAVYMKTATEVGGDYYDFNVQPNGVLNIGIGDATGHGLQAGTMITLMKGFFTADVAKFSPQKFLEHCNGIIRDIKLGRILMSFSHLRFENNCLLISSAGMPPVYYHHKKNNRTEEIIIQGLPLGAMGSASYKLVEKQLNSGDTILLLTDGLPEQMNNNKVIFDYSRVLKYFDEIADYAPNEIINRLVQKADDWMDGQKQDDDVTFVVIKVK